MSWKTEYDSDSSQIEHLDGVPWHKAPIPRRFHRCRPQTRGYVNTFTPVLRCACGAINFDNSGWAEKNSRRK